MARAAAFTTKELSKRTWPDYVRFFSQGNGWDHCGCTFAQGFRAPKELRRSADKRDWNLDVKCRLVEVGRAHGILVYARGEPVGWCLFGPANELPIVEPGPRRRLFAKGEERLWKITCFCTHPDHSQRGVTGVALRAALRSIAKKGGGPVEATPVALAKGDPSTDERLAALIGWYSTLTKLIKAHGRFSEPVEEHLRNRVRVIENVDGVGEVEGSYYGRFNVGTVSMFSREGASMPCPWCPPRGAPIVHPDRHPTRIVMRKTVAAAR